MKLVRITTNNRNANFSNDFNEDIIIEKNSQICVNTVSMEVDTSEIEISGDNDNIFWKMRKSEAEKRITLNHTAENDPYNNNNFGVLLSDIQNKLNNSLSPVSVEIGRQWRVAVDNDNKISIENKQSDYTDKGQMFIDNVPNKVLPSGGDAQSVVNTFQTALGLEVYQKATEAITLTNQAMTYSNHAMTKGCGVFRVQIGTMVDSDANVLQQGFIVGVSSTPISSFIDSRDMLNSDIKYAVHIPRTDSKYAFFNGAIRTVSTVDVGYTGANNVSNDVIEVQIALGRIKIIVYKTASVTQNVILNYNYDGSPLYPFIIMRGLSTTVAKIKKLTTDPYYDPPSGISDITEDYTGHGLGVRPPIGSTAIVNSYIRFGSSSLSGFLGFTNPRNPILDFQSSRQLLFQGQDKFSYTDLSDAFVVMMDNIKLMSYDGYDRDGRGGGRQNIICIIPKSDSDSSVLYEPNNNNWLDMENADVITLRQIRARILKNDLTKLTTNGLSTITFFIRTKPVN